MSNKETPFEIRKTFGLGVLLKLTKTRVHGIEIKEKHGKLTSNITMGELIKAVDATIKSHNIRLRMV